MAPKLILDVDTRTDDALDRARTVGVRIAYAADPSLATLQVARLSNS